MLKANEYGIFMRSLRKRMNENLNSMSEKLDVSIAFLSAIEVGKKTIPLFYADRITEIYGLSLEEKKEFVKKMIKAEEEKFLKTLTVGEAMLMKNIKDSSMLSAENMFKLYDTFGFPLELTKEIAEENDLKVDEEGFKREMQIQKERAKAATQKISLTDDLVYVEIENKFGSTNFVGYDEVKSQSKIIATVDAGEFVDIILDKTPFYAECGGQVGDNGIIEKHLEEFKSANTSEINLYEFLLNSQKILEV